MTRDEIIKMAREAYGDWYLNAVPPELERFANLVADAEREACASLCEEIEENCWETWNSLADPQDQGSAIGAAHCAAAIRARGDK